MEQEKKAVLHDPALDAAIEGLKEIKMHLTEPITLGPLPSREPRKLVPLETRASLPSVTNEMIYSAVRSLAQAIEHLCDLLEKQKDAP